MAEKTIMLVCSAGMSTSMLVQRMKKAAEADGLDVLDCIIKVTTQKM